MAIFKRPGSDFYYLKFEKDGKQYKRSTECTDKREAAKWDTPERRRAIVNEASQEAAAASQQEAAATKATQDAAKRFDFERALAYYLSLSPRNGDKHSAAISGQWRDFAAWATAEGISTLDQIAKGHAAAYLNRLSQQGRFAETRPGMAPKPLSGRSRNASQVTLRAIFAAAMEPAEIAKNPFELPKVDNNTEERDAFEIAELKAILDTVQNSPQLRPLVIIAACTGLRTGDACSLAWEEVDLRGPVGFIRKKTSKTGKAVSIPIMPPLRRLLEELRTPKDPSGFVCPVLASQYQRNPSKLSRDFAAVLDRLGIAREKKVAGHSRPHVFKDLHSFRHTFVYLAAEAGIPLAVVQGIVGHASQRMTEHYANHATDKAKAEAMKKLPDFFAAPAPVEKKESEDPLEAEILHPAEAKAIEAAAMLRKALKAPDFDNAKKFIKAAIKALKT